MVRLQTVVTNLNIPDIIMVEELELEVEGVIGEDHRKTVLVWGVSLAGRQ